MSSDVQRTGLSGIGDRGAEFAELIARLEKETGTDRDLADEVLFACGWQTNFDQNRIAEVRANGWKCEAENGEEYTDTFEEFMNCACWYPPGSKPFRDAWQHGHYRPNPLASFDAARALKPDGYYWHAGEGKMRNDEPLGAASIIEPGTLDTITEAEHASVIIAFCIAALRARAALSKAETK